MKQALIVVSVAGGHITVSFTITVSGVMLNAVGRQLHANNPSKQ